MLERVFNPFDNYYLVTIEDITEADIENVNPIKIAKKLKERQVALDIIAYATNLAAEEIKKL